MKILELNFEKTWRGGERQTLYNIIGFLAEKNEVDLVCRKGFQLENEAQKAKVKVISFSNIIQVFWFLCTKAKAYEVIHAQTSHILTYCLLSKPFHQKKIVFSRRVDFLPKGFFTKIKYLKTDKIIAVSKAVKNTLELFCKRKDIEVISDVAIAKKLDIHKTKRFLEDLNIPNSKFIIGTIAALDKSKDPLTTIRAICELKKQRDDFVVLHFGDGPLFDLCVQAIKDYNLENQYFLFGFKPNVEDYYSLFDVFVLNSVEEGLGSSILDAFLYKVPVVGTKTGGIIELLENGRGKACDIQAEKEIANGINLLLSKRSESRKFQIENAYNYVILQHSLETISQKYLSVFIKC